MQDEVKVTLKVQKGTVVAFPDMNTETDPGEGLMSRITNTRISFDYDGIAYAIYRLSAWEHQDKLPKEIRYYFAAVMDGPTDEEMLMADLEYILNI